MADKKSWRDYSKQAGGSSNNSDKQRKSWRDYSDKAGTTDYFSVESANADNGSYITNRVNNWLRSHNSYVRDYENRFSGRKYSYEDAYVSDSSDWANTMAERKKKADAEADAILAYIEQNKNHIDRDWARDVFHMINSAKRSKGKIVDIASEDDRWWNSFGTEELLRQYGSAEKAYTATGKAIAKRNDQLVLDTEAYEAELEELKKFVDEAYDIGGWYEYYQAGKTDYLDYDKSEDPHRLEVYNRLQNEYGGDVSLASDDYIQRSRYLEEAKRVQEQAREDDEYEKQLAPYLALMQNADFAEKSAFKSKKVGDYKYTNDADGRRYIYDTGYSDIWYDYINRQEDALDLQGEMDTTDSSFLVGLDKGYLKEMTDEEIKIYNYLYETQNKDAAEEFLSLITSDLAYRRRKRQQEEAALYATEHPFHSSVWSILSSPLKAVSAIGQTVDYLDDGKIDENAGYNKYSYQNSAIRNTVANNIAKPENGAWGKVGSWTYQLGMSMGDFVMNTAVSGGNSVIASALMASGAMADTVIAAKDRGLSDDQAFTLGVIAGGAEIITEKFSLEALLKGDLSKGTLQYILTNAFTEGTEEVSSSLINLFADVIISKDQSEWEMSIKKYLEEHPGTTETDAFTNVLFDTAASLGLDFIGGQLMGGFMGSVGAGINYVTEVAPALGKNKEAIEKHGKDVPDMIKAGLSSDPKSRSYDLANFYQSKIDSGKELSGYEIRQLKEAVETDAAIEFHGKLEEAHAQFVAETKKEAINVAKARLTELGETGDVDAIADAVAKKAMGEKLTSKEKKLLVNSNGSQVAKEMTLEEGENTYKSLGDRIGDEGQFGVSESGKAVVRDSGKKVNLSKAEVTKVGNGEITFKLEDGTEVYAGDIDFESDDQSYLVSAVSSIENITTAAATAMLHDIVDTSKPLGKQLNGIDEAFTYGYNGYSEADLKAGSFTGGITKKQMMSAYKFGQAARSANAEAADSPKVRMRTELQAKLTEAERTAKQRRKFESGDVGVYFMDGKNITKVGESGGYKGTGQDVERRMAAVNYAKLLSKLGIGNNYYFFESYKNENGERVYKDADGNEVSAPNGFYREGTGDIYIDLNAGNEGQGVALFTLGHELTHFIKEWSEKKFKVLADFLVAEYGNTDLTMRERVLAKQAELEDIRKNQDDYKPVKYQEAFEEVVADAMSAMLADGNLHEKLAELRTKDKGLVDKIIEFFNRMIAKFQALYKDLDPEQRDARDVRAMKDSFDRIQQAFAEALVEASDNFQAVQTQKNTTEDGGVKYQIRGDVVDVNGKEYDSVVELEYKVFNRVKRSGGAYIEFIRNNLIKKKIAVLDGNGGLEVIEFAGPKERVWKDGAKNDHAVIGELLSAKNDIKKLVILNAVETASISRISGSNTNHLHQWLDENGWQERTSYVMTEEGIIYPVILKIARARDGRNILYDVHVNIEEGIAADKTATSLRAKKQAGQAVGTTTPSNRATIHQDKPKVKHESAKAVDVEVDEKTESAAPTVLKSERTWTSSDYVQERDKAAKEIANAIGVSEKKAKDYIDSINSIAKMIAEDRSRLDYFSSPGRSSFVGNVEYGGSFDFSTLCKKRRLLTGTFTAIQKALPNTALTADEILDIRNRMKEAGLEVSCGLCYVEGSRANMGQFAKEFLRLYKQYYPDAWQPNMADVNTPDGIEWVRINHPECYEQYEYFWNHYGTLKTGDKNLFASQQKPKLYQLHTEYNGEILSKFKDDDNVEEKNLNGGIRLQSFSDFEIVHLIDTMQIIMDMSRVGLAGQAYTKVPDFAWALGDTGLKINLSLIAKGVDENGKLIFDDVEGMPISEAMKLRDRYSENVGTILVAFNDEQLQAAMADDRVDFIIPFHRSQWKKSQYEAMGLPAKTKDYTYMQNEKYIKPQYHEYRGRMVKDKATNYMPNEYWDFSKSGKENAEAYLEMCARNNKRPKFYKLLQNNGDGSYSLKADGSTDGYWKLLIDFKMYDNKGNGSPQMPVKPEFNMTEATRMLDNYKGGHSNFPVAQGIVNGFVSDYKKSHKVQKYSERSGNAAPDRDSIGRRLSKGQLEYFKDSKARDDDGNLLVMYHGTSKGGYTVFDTYYGNHGLFGIGSYFTDNKEIAKTYTKKGRGTSPQVYEAYLDIKNPLDMDAQANPKEWAEAFPDVDFPESGTNEAFYRAVEEWCEDEMMYKWDAAETIQAGIESGMGYDGITHIGGGRVDPNGVRHRVYIAFQPEQIKSVDNKNPTTDPDIRYSERSTGTSNRTLLANAFEGLSRNSDEYAMIQEYRNRIRLLEEQEEKLDKINAEIREIRFTSGKYDAKKLAELEAKKKEISKAITRHDKKLLEMEVSAPFRKVIEQERKKEAQKTKAHIAEIQQNKQLRAEQAELRHKVRKVIRDLDKILKRGNKERNVKEDMKGFVSKALELADYLFTDHISNDDLIMRGIDADLMRGDEAELVRETEEIIQRIQDNYGTITEEEYKRLTARKKRNMEALRELLTKQRNRRLNTPVYNLFDDLVTEYAKLKNSDQDAVKAAYNPEVERFLRSYMGIDEDGTDPDRKTLLQNMRVADMTTEELEHLYYAYTMILKSVLEANKLFVQGKAESVQKMAEQISADFSKRKIPKKDLAIIAQKIANKIGWDYEKLYYALDRIGSETFTELVLNVANSENIVMQDVIEAVEFRDEMVEKYGFNDWDYSKKMDRDFVDNTGKKFRLTLGELMSLYAYSRRKGAWDHIEYGGFAFGQKELKNPRPADTYKLTREQCEAITDLLTKEQKGYVEAMQKFLSDVMGGKGNEVSMMLYGIKLFGEKNYFPLHIYGAFKSQVDDANAKAAEGFKAMKNAGFTHALKPNAKAPFVLDGFNEVWSDHVNEMSRYHGAVPALEDLRRVMNIGTYTDSAGDSISIKQLMENAFGKEAVDYFDALYREANSGAVRDKLQADSHKLLSLFRKNSVAYSLSVLIQQPASVVRAYAMIDRKYFGLKGFGVITSGVIKAAGDKWTKAHTNAYNEMLKYAPGVTMAKEIGGFDTHTGSSIRGYLLDTKKSFGQKAKTDKHGKVIGGIKAAYEFVDDNAIANLPNVADKIAWIEIWNACKRETIAKHKDLVPTSDAFLQIVGDRFTEVIRATQVYDSMFSKSPMLKSKNLAVQYLVSFMNEPNTVANMAEKAVRDMTKGNWKNGLKTVHVVIHSIIFTNLLKSIIYAMRDDDEDETYIEKYIEALSGGLFTDFIPFNYIPLVRDAWSLAQGYDVERADMAIVADAIDAIYGVSKNWGADTDSMTEDQLEEFDKKVIEANWKLVESLAAFAGIPVKNIRREINGFMDHARIASENAGKTTLSSAWDKVIDGVIDSIPFMSSKPKTDKLYEAIIAGDKAYVERIKGSYNTESSYQSAVRKALRENDSRIHEAAIARYEVRTEDYKRIFREIQAEGIFSFDDIMSAVNSEENKIRKKVEPEKQTSSYSAKDYVEAIVLNDMNSATAIKNDIIDTMVANDKTRKEADKEFTSSISTGIRDAYSSGLLDEASAKRMLQDYADKDEDKAASMVSYWAFCEDHPEYKDIFSESNVADYHKFAEPSDISVEVFARYVEGTKGLSTEYNALGDVEVSKREQVLEVIDSLPISKKQKDALYLAAGYSESKIWDVPW